MENERWVPVKNYEGRYEVSDAGRVRSLKRTEECMGGIRHRDACLLIPNCHNGYARLRLCKDGVASRFSVHRIVASHFLDNPKNYPQINHKDGNKTNNAASNLEWCNASQNALHKAYSLGKGVGEDNWHSVAKEIQVRQIRELASLCMPSAEIADRLGLGLSCVEHIRYRRSWKHVQ